MSKGATMDNEIGNNEENKKYSEPGKYTQDFKSRKNDSNWANEINSTKEEYIESIDALFLKLELAYHYQFYKVFGTDEKLKEGKKLWAVTLKNETPEVILEAVESVIHRNLIYLH